MRVPDGVLPYITSFGAEGVDLTKVPPHSDVLPTATFSEPMSQVAVQYEMLTPGGWVTCPCDPGLNPGCNQCPGQGPLGLYTTYRTTYLSSGTYCSYATRDMSGEPLTAVPGSTTPGNVSYNYTSSKVRIEEPVVRPGEVLEYNINPINIGVKTTSDISQLSGYTDPSTQSFNYPFKYTLSDGSKFFQYPFYSRFAATTYRIFADAGSGNKDYVNVSLKPQPRIAKVMFPKEMLIKTCLCRPGMDENLCKNGGSEGLGGFDYNSCPFLTLPTPTGTTRVWMPKWVYNDFAVVLFGAGIATGNPLLMIGSGILAIMNYIFDFKLEAAKIKIDESHLILDEIEITPVGYGIHFYLNYRLWVNSGEAIYLGGLYRYHLGGRTLFGGLRISWTMKFGFDSASGNEELQRIVFKGFHVNFSDFNVTLDWVDVPGASSSQNNQARDEIVNEVWKNFMVNMDENGMTGAQRLEKTMKYALLTSTPTVVYYWDNNNKPADTTNNAFVSRTCEGEYKNRCVNYCVSKGFGDEQNCRDNYCNPLFTVFYGLADIYSDVPDYSWMIQVGSNMSLWENWFSSGTFRGRRCDEFTVSAPGLGITPLNYIPSQAHYSNPDQIPFVGGKESAAWKWPYTADGLTDRDPIIVRQEIYNFPILGPKETISIYLNYVDCLSY